MRRNLALYFTLGFPDQETVERFTDSIDPGEVDYVEFGFPSSSPIYDGPRIRATHRTAMENYDSASGERIFRKLRGKGIRIYSLTYYRDIQDRPEEFASYLHRNGFSGVVIPDLLVDYAESVEAVVDILHSSGIELVPFFNPSTPDMIIRNVSGLTSSWIYYGMQPSTGISVPFDVEEVAGRITSLLPDREINFGFGIRTEEQVAKLRDCGAGGVIIGTALIDMLSSGNLEGFREFTEKMRGVLNGS